MCGRALAVDGGPISVDRQQSALEGACESNGVVLNRQRTTRRGNSPDSGEE